LGITVTNSHNDERNRMPFQSDADKVEAEEFANSLLVDQNEFFCEEIIHHNGSRAPEPLRMVYYAEGGMSSDTDTDAAQTLARSESPQKVKTFTPQHQRRSRHFVAQRAAQGRSQSQRNSSRKAVSQDKVREF
jgi:hypothetical protein